MVELNFNVPFFPSFFYLFLFRYEEYENFIRTFDDRLRKDENVILIMSAIVLFTPNRLKIVHTDVILLEQVNHTNYIQVKRM